PGAASDWTRAAPAARATRLRRFGVTFTSASRAREGRARSVCRRAGARPSEASHGLGRRASPRPSPSRRAYDRPMPDVTIHDDGPVRVLTLDRPAVRNALSRALREELRAALADAEADDAVRSVVITGAGEAFCAGLDLRELEATAALTREQHREDTLQLAELLTAIHSCPRPVVAAVNGPAVAGGAGIVTACDVALAAPEARLGYTETRIGFVPALVAVLLLHQVGEKHARELLLGAHLVDASR